MFVIGTAGHVDHGKSSLVRSLTGIDPDRFSEEKKRGLTIDLGFAWMELPSGNEVSIIDVPGHESFVSNMLTGVGSIDLALLIVSAEESVMPQTIEHLSILDLLQVKKCIVVLTKTDLVDDEIVQLSLLEIEELLLETSFSGSKILPVSIVSGEGLNELTSELDQVLSSVKKSFNEGHAMMSIDRSFTISGFGTVVTGTLLGGKLNVGVEIELNPGQKRARVRGIQSHNRDLDEVMPGTRVAVNLSGVDHHEIYRGQVLSTPGQIKPTNAIDVQLTVLDSVPNMLRHNMTVTFHQGTAVSLAKLRLLEGDNASAGDVVWAQLKTDDYVCVNRGDRFVIRSNMTTLGGGEIVQINAKRHKRNDLKIISRLENLFEGDSSFLIKDLIESNGPIMFEELRAKSGFTHDFLKKELISLTSKNLIINLANPEVGETYYYSVLEWKNVCKKIEDILKDFHQDFPLRTGYSKEAIRTTLQIKQNVFSLIVNSLECNDSLVDKGSVLSLPSFERRIDVEQEQEIHKFLTLLNSNEFSPPSDFEIDMELLSYMESVGLIVIASDKVVFSMDSYQKMLSMIREFIGHHSRISPAEMRDLLGTSRRYVMALVDYLDKENITRRIGDYRILR